MLFGHQNDENTDENKSVDDAAAAAVTDDTTTVPTVTANPLSLDSETGISLPTVPEVETTSVSTPDDTSVEPEEAAPIQASTPELVEAPVKTTREELASPSNGDDELIALKQQALAQLGPLVDHLDQSPEEKFRTTMMMIQSADNQALIKTAYEAAQAITDDKIRAQALLDIVNEINYFTQQSQKN